MHPYPHILSVRLYILAMYVCYMVNDPLPITPFTMTAWVVNLCAHALRTYCLPN